jgi:CBS domain containing-hemolysin-like protein
MESVLLSTTKTFLNVKLDKGFTAAKTFIKLKENIERPLAAILSLNTVAHTVGAAGVGAQAAKLFGEFYFGIISAVLTLLILIFSEIIPKTIGARYWRNLALISGKIMHVMIIFTYPLVIMTEYIAKLFAKNPNEFSVSRSEISALANIGTKEGVFEEKENKIIQNLIHLKTIKVSQIMTPRIVVKIADENLTVDEFLHDKNFLHFSRVPVYSENKENITGYIFRQTAFQKITESKGNTRLKEIARDIAVVTEFLPVFDCWEILLKRKEHIALIIDEYGGMDGIVTMEDIIETLLGIEIVDEGDRVTDMQQYARKKWNERKAKYDFLSDSEK